MLSWHIDFGTVILIYFKFTCGNDLIKIDSGLTVLTKAVCCFEGVK